VIALKENQPTLFRATQQVCATTPPESVHVEEERTRDRVTTRTTRVFRVPEQAPFLHWEDLVCVVAVERCGTRGGEPYFHRGFYISSQLLSAQEFAAGIRGHWEIENGLHWSKDVVLREDACATRAGQAPQNWALLRNLAITLFRMHGYRSTTRALRRFAHDIHALFQFLVE
jgi:predicted transposase YbfD/YdcC